MQPRYLSPPNWPPPPPGWTPPRGWTPDPHWGPAPPGWQFWDSDGLARTTRHLSPTLPHTGKGGRFAYIVALALGLMTGIAAIARELRPDLPSGIWLTAAFIGLAAGVLSAALDLSAVNRQRGGGLSLPAGVQPRASRVRGGWLAATAIFGVASLAVPYFFPLVIFGLLMALNRRRAAAGAALAIFFVLLVAVVVLVLIIASSAVPTGYAS